LPTIPEKSGLSQMDCGGIILRRVAARDVGAGIWNRRRLAAAGAAVPDNLHWAPIDFE
jgi:hypothetical protein